MYRVIAVLGAALTLAACSSSSDLFKTPDWFKSNTFEMHPALETVRFESVPPGADAKTSTGQSCRTPCALAVPGSKAFDVTFNLTGFQPDLEKVEVFDIGDGTTKLRPNPVLAELTPLPPPPKKAKKRRHVVHKRKAVAKKPARPAARKPAAPTAAPTRVTPQQTQAPSPWPAAPPPPKQ
jgi:hypothetical protein